jgi:hypothetical protein
MHINVKPMSPHRLLQHSPHFSSINPVFSSPDPLPPSRLDSYQLMRAFIDKANYLVHQIV